MQRPSQFYLQSFSHRPVSVMGLAAAFLHSLQALPQPQSATLIMSS